MKLRRQTGLTRRDCGRMGAAAVEAAIIIPLIGMILLGSIDVGQSVYVAQVVNEASREGARQACRSSTTSEDAVRATVRSFIRKSFSGVANGSVQVNFSADNGDSIPSGDLSSMNSGSPITVQVVLDYDAVRWTPGFLGLGGRTIATTTVMRRE